MTHPRVRYDRSRDVFIGSEFVYNRDDARAADYPHRHFGDLFNIRDAVEAERVIYASGYILDQGVPKRSPGYTGCIGVEESCVWVWDTHDPGFGTSFRAPALGSTLASLLAVFPDYDVFDLASVTNSCAKRFPSLAGGGVLDVPCMIETICAETNSNSPACGIDQPTAPIFRRTDIGWLESPVADRNILYAHESGVSTIFGWVCDAEKVFIELNGERFQAGYGTVRTDTKKVCGDTDNGFSFLWNWNILGDGIHTVRAYADDRLFASTKVKVTTLGKEVARGLTFKGELLGYSTGKTPTGELVTLEWWESKQNFVIIRHR